MTRPLRVFLCHASQDKPAVRELYNTLKTENWIDPWLDKAKILPGQDWRTVIEKAVEEADVVIVCLSNQSVNKEGFVQREIKYAYDIALEKPEETIFLIPLRLDDCAVPRGLRSFHWVDYFGDDTTEAYSALLEALKLRLAQILKLEKKEIAPNQPQPQPQPVNKLLVDREIGEATSSSDRKLIPKKPFTRVLDPSSLSPKRTDREEIIKRSVKNNNIRWLGIGGIIFLILICSVFGLNYLIKNIPVAAATISSPTVVIVTISSLTDTPTFKVPTFTSVPFTSTPQPTSMPTSTLGIGSAIQSEIDSMTLMYVPLGEFSMGSNNGAVDEKPIHQVYLDAFWIDQTEVTNKQYSACVNVGACAHPTQIRSFTHNNYYGNTQFDNYPVIYVDWNMANDYCYWVGRKLPTEAEWEKAARGTDARTYPWGSDVPTTSLLNYDKNVGDTTEVGKYPAGASVYGALDMAGNVWEWVEDWYSSSYYDDLLLSNPLGPDSGRYRVLRGGSWLVSDNLVRTAYRDGNGLSNSNYGGVGFRCSRSP